MDFVVNTTEKYRRHMGMLPTWGDKFNKKWVITQNGSDIELGAVDLKKMRLFDPPADERRDNDGLLVLFSE